MTPTPLSSANLQQFIDAMMRMATTELLRVTGGEVVAISC
jgi:hypothetical protein